MALSIKRTPELWGEDARHFDEAAAENGHLSTPKLNNQQRSLLKEMLESAKDIVFPPR